MDILVAYHKKIGGPPTQGKSTKKGAAAGGAKNNKRSASAAFKDSPAQGSAKKGKSASSKMNGAFDPPDGSWEDHVLRISSIVEETTSPTKTTGKKGGGDAGGTKLIGLLEWHNGHKTQHSLAVLRRKAPQKLLDYYELHL